MFIGLFVIIWLARYLGPSEFGLFNYVQAYVAMFSVFATLGLQSIVVRDLVKYPESRLELVSSAFALRVFGAMIAVLLASISILWVRPSDNEVWLLVIILSSALLPQASEIIDYYYQSNIDVKPLVVIRSSVFVVFSFIKVGVILLEGGLLFFAVISTVEVLLSAFFVMRYAARNKISVKLNDVSRRVCFRMLRECWPLIISGLSVMIYMRIDQIMLGQMLDDEAVGIFSAAARISEAWYFVPIAIISSVAPILTKIHQNDRAEVYRNRLFTIMRLLTWMSIVIALIVSVVSAPLINVLYGEQYKQAADVLIIHAWAGIFVCLGVSVGPWFTNAKLLHLTMYQTILGALVNIALNLFLLPIYGVVGAAISTVISYAVSALIFNAFLKQTRPVFMLQIRSFFK